MYHIEAFVRPGKTGLFYKYSNDHTPVLVPVQMEQEYDAVTRLLLVQNREQT